MQCVMSDCYRTSDHVHHNSGMDLQLPDTEPVEDGDADGDGVRGRLGRLGVGELVRS